MNKKFAVGPLMSVTRGASVKDTTNKFVIRKPRGSGQVRGNGSTKTPNVASGSWFTGNRKGRRQQVKSLGKDKPEPPQSAIVINVFFPKSENQTRAIVCKGLEQKDLLAPLGDSESLDVKQGVLVFCLKSGSSSRNMRPTQISSNSVSDIYAFDCVNGLPNDTRLRFVGWATTDNMMSNAYTIAIGAVQTTGVCSATNTGPFTIEAFSDIYFDEVPYTLFNGSGEMINGVNEIGLPADKFRPAIYGFRNNDIQAMMMSALTTLSKNLSDFDQNTGSDVQENVNKAVQIAKELNQAITAEKPPSFPLKNLLIIHVAQHCLQQNLISRGSQEPYSLYKIIELVRREFVDTWNTERKTFNHSIGEDDSTQGTLFALFQNNSHPGLSHEHTAKLLEQLSLIRMHVEWGLRAWLSEHWIGQIYNTAESGAPMKLCLRHGRP